MHDWVRFMPSEAVPTAVEGEHDYAVLECTTVDTCVYIQHPCSILNTILGVAHPAIEVTLFPGPFERTWE